MKKYMLVLSLVFVTCLGVMLLAGCATNVSAAAGSSSSMVTSGGSDAIGAVSKATANAASSLQTSGSDEYIGEEEAKAIALGHAGLAEADVTFVHVLLGYDDGRWEHEVEFYSGSAEYDYDIDAVTGEILSFDRDAEYYSGTGGMAQTADGNYIGEDEAKRIALEHVGFDESSVSALRVEFDMDDGRAEYEVEWYVGNTEYSFEIDAANGNILGYETDND